MGQIDYPAHLAAMWQKAIAPRDPDAPSVISLFAGGGGSLTGYMMVGYRDLLAVEWDNNAVETLRLNWPELDVYHGDIAKLSVDEVLKRTGLRPYELDLLDGSPPCQGFSTAGKRIMDDPRNQLFREYVRLLRGLMPKVFVMENVSGMVKGKMKLVFVEILKELKASGYKVKACLLNAMYFHVPQSRERMIFIGVRDDLGIEPSHPKGEGRPITVREAWLDCLQEHGTPPNGQLAQLVGLMPQGASNGSGRYSIRAYGKAQFYGVNRLAWEEPSPTIIKTWQRVFHPIKNAPPSTKQVKRIGSFPDACIFPGNEGDTWERIGNSVPPLMAEAIGRHIRQNILELITTPG